MIGNTGIISFLFNPSGDTMAASQNTRRIFLYVLAGIIVLIAAALIFSICLIPATCANGFLDGKKSDSQQNARENLTDLRMPLFRVTEGHNDTIQFENWSADRQLADAPSPEECPFYAKKVLEPYGGMPRDAELDSIQDDSRICIHTNSGENCSVTSRRIVYLQKPYNVTIHGTAGRISMTLTAGGIPSGIYKHWLTLDEVGTVHIIPASEAIERLRQGEGKNIPLDPLDLTILSAEPGYYTPENVTNASYLEPVWTINARDEIQKIALTLYIPAGKTPAQTELYPVSGPGISYNFSEAGGTIPRPEVSTASHVLVGTSGPVGEDAARESIRKFTANPGIALDYHGQSSRQHEGCGGQNYNWVFYDFTSGSCEFYINTYTGSVIFASLDPSCADIGKKDLPEQAKQSPDEAKQNVSDFIRERYPQFDQRHMKLQYWNAPNSYQPDIGFSFTGDNTNIDLSFDPDDGHLKQYAVYNSNFVGKCASDPGVFTVIMVAAALIVLHRRKR
jgi:hypothetical protein